MVNLFIILLIEYVVKNWYLVAQKQARLSNNLAIDLFREDK